MNTNDLEDIFKQAANQYPLRTDSADWEEVARELNEDDKSLVVISVSTLEGIEFFLWPRISAS